MSSVINILDEATRNKIAAGEVVERPASCVKELVENAVDAGAKSIEVEIADGGQSYIRVTDDGCGMSAEDARKCIIRHATSKISSAEDIFSISSLGFRGEAVPSIAAVSHMQITTRRPDDDFASHLVLDGGEVSGEEQVGAPAGTTIEVSDLFYNTPARRKFLKSERTESAKISDMITKLALAQPAIAFTFTNNGRTTLQTGGGGDLKETIANIYGAALAKEIFPVSYDDDGVAIEGYVGKPSVLKSTRAWQTCIVNGRIVYNALMFKAIENAYHAMLPKAGYPFAMIYIHIDPAAVDVNVHPAKTEIKFADEQGVYRAVYRSIVAALVEQEKPEEIATNIQLPERSTSRIEGSSASALQELPFEGEPRGTVHEPGAGRLWDRPVSSTQSVAEESRRAYAAPARGAEVRKYVPPAPEPDQSAQFSRILAEKGQAQHDDVPVITFDGEDDVFIPLGEVADCFIIAKKGQDLYIVDQHAAHERIRYDMLCRRAEKLPSQQLLTPEFIEVDSEDMTLLLERPEVFEDLGYVYSEAGPKTLRVEEAPCDLPTSQIGDSLRDICRALHEKSCLDKAALRHRALAYLSCRGAIKAGDALNIRQMKNLLDELFHTDKPYVCPHGRPVIVRFTPHELAKLFKRT